MRRILPLLLLVASLSGQNWEKWAGEWTTETQRGFAYDAFSIGRQRNRGHTLVGIGWLETSLGEDPEHEGEQSYGPLGLGLPKMREYRPGFSDPTLIWLAETDLEWAGNVALDIFEHELGLLLAEGFDEHAAWMYAYGRYNKGNRWRQFKDRAKLFNKRVRFLKGIM